MRIILEIARTFFISLEFPLVIAGVAIQCALGKRIDHLLSGVNISDDLFKWAIAIPSALLCWSLVSGRKLLFPEKDKSSILQKWQDYWRLKVCFHAALAWNLIFMLISIYAWMGDWKHPSSFHVVSLVISIAGSAICTFSIYNAQTRVEEEVSQYAGKS
ncbi:hypothetical protein [Paraburkholderia saeva]|uniref:Uncharacterized protein n=1 Tax=Paraburkholderia saeva TaxID=2777537 RepID=A0A9N8RSF5_9BURK|nr:hypothetical protein [Paraburkholderia saeva]CAG4886900.1 hypothetical protein LMG31841_00287 [Paraburkholderia saeva]